PGAITGFEVETEIDTEVRAVLSWINPTVDSDGNSLGDMDGIKVFRGTNPMNLVEIADLPGTVGESMNCTDILPAEGSYTHRLVPYNASGNGIAYNNPMTFFGYETVPGAPRNITFTQDGSSHMVISWDEVDYG